MNYILYDDPTIRVDLYPLSLTRPIADFRVGILKISEKWSLYLNSRVYYKTAEYLQKKFPFQAGADTVYISAHVCPTAELADKILSLKNDESIYFNHHLIAYRNTYKGASIMLQNAPTIITKVWHIFSNNGKEIKNDIDLLSKHKKFYSISDPHTRCYNEKNIYVEEGVKIHAAILNADNGPIYLGKHSEVQEGAMIRGPFALCENSIVNMGGKMRGDNTIGPYSKVGGEVSNSVIFGYSNKAHDGFMGNSVIGEWCNFGADSNTSNLKNNYANIKIYSYAQKKYVDSGLQFCGLIMGDHSKCGINIMFDSGSIVGVNASIYGAKYSPKFIPSFSWGDIENLTEFHFDKAIEVARRVMARRNVELTQTDIDILREVHILESKYKSELK
ncbi:MAG: putative sugar nucleotidyl transferase [Cytophagaceae bacterium]|nr:putative sugar nucleotidyl transferase [Cytophagaceae bacterium]MDW8455573.1 putative sugar nucleotidyl transferase [Cytophagaceae bacterium]